MRILITRPREQAEELANGLNAIGAKAIFLPTIEIQPVADTTILDRALSKLHCYDWLVLTSVNGVKATLERLAALGTNTFPEKLRVAAVGPKTASKLADKGIPVDFIPEEYTGEAILPGLGDLRGRWVLLPTADIATDTLSKAIEANRGVAHLVTAYQTLPAKPDSAGLAALKSGIDMLTFTSGSSARNFVSLVREAGLDPFNVPGQPKVACIGPKTAAVARDLGFTVHIVAEPCTVEGLIKAIQPDISGTSQL